MMFTDPVKDEFQSALPRGERRLQKIRSRAISEISIRAPARGATKPSWQKWKVRNISIRAPARGATKTILQPLRHLFHFNPRSREGSDLTESADVDSGKHFNPRSREGSDVEGSGGSVPG